MGEYPKKTGPNSWIVQVRENGKTKELYLKFPDGCIDQMGWDIGDTLMCEELSNGDWSLTKKVE